MRSGETYKREMSDSEVNYKVGDLVEHNGSCLSPRGMGIVVDLDEDDDPVVYYLWGRHAGAQVAEYSNHVTLIGSRKTNV